MQQIELQIKSPQRFQSREDLHGYMHGLFDVTYLLDYAEAQAMVDKSAKEKQLMYSQISYDSAKNLMLSQDQLVVRLLKN